MDTIGKPIAAPVRNATVQSYSSTAVSVAFHLLVFVVLVHHSRRWVAPIRYPGTEHGHSLVLSYLPGRAPAPSTAPPPKAPPLTIKAQLNVPTPEKMQPQPS